MNIFEALRADHDDQRTLVDLLVKTHGDSEGREELHGRLRTAMQAHAKSEERCFYVPLMDDDLTQEKARHSVAEHHELDELLDALDTTDYSSPAWLSTAKDLRERLRHHLEEEETEVFQLAGKVLTDDQKSELAERYRSMMAEEA